MNGIVCCILLLVISIQGSMKTEYKFSKQSILNCIFPENSTWTAFVVYFYYENGKTELLVYCEWEGDKLECIGQQGFKCRLPVSGTAEIEVPQRFVTRPGKIGYTLSGDDPSNVNFCHFIENQSEEQKESENKMQQSNIKENNDHQASRDFPAWADSLVIAAVFVVAVSVIALVLYKKHCRRNTLTDTSEKSVTGFPFSVSSVNNIRDDNHQGYFSLEVSNC